MRQALRRHWRSVPTSIRRPLTLFVGLTLVLTSGAIGWLPGPGGIPVFLLGIFVLASEFKWADDFGRIILKLIHDIAQWARSNPLMAAIALLASLTTSATIMYMLFIK
ncbi:MAG: PGPGW domain-containing protein [Candidatus Saccharimonadales bacterium]